MGIDTATIITIGGVVVAVTTIVTTSGKLAKIAAIKIGRYAVNKIRKEDITGGYVKEAIDVNAQINASLIQISHTMQEMQLAIDKNRVDNLRIELLQLMHDTPEKAEIIEQVYDNYKKQGGNSYITQAMKEWREIHGREVIRKRIKH